MSYILGFEVQTFCEELNICDRLWENRLFTWFLC